MFALAVGLGAFSLATLASPAAASEVPRVVAWSEVSSPAGRLVGRLVTVRLPITERLAWNLADGKPEFVGNAEPPVTKWERTPSALVGERGVFGGFFRCLVPYVAPATDSAGSRLGTPPRHAEYEVTFALPAGVPLVGDWVAHSGGVSLHPKAEWLTRKQFSPESRVAAFSVAEADLAKTKVEFAGRANTGRFSERPPAWVSIVDSTRLPGVTGVKIGAVESALVELRVGGNPVRGVAAAGFLRAQFLQQPPEGGAVQLKIAGLDAWVACPPTPPAK